MKSTKRIAYMAYNMTLINHNELETFWSTITCDFSSIFGRIFWAFMPQVTSNDLWDKLNW